MQPVLDLCSSLHEVFGFAQFRALQAEAVEAALGGRDVLVVMPTGAGKSLCFQLPAAVSDGVTLVVSPLIALMRDQVVAMNTRTSFDQLGCAYLNSLQSGDEQREILERLRANQLKLLYVAPERFRSGGFMEALRSVKLARFVVDEAHCISEWGHDFRPDYLSLKPVVEELNNPPLMAVTATATARVRDSIIANLGMREPEVFIGGFNRPNLHFSTIKCKNDNERQNKLLRALPKLMARGGSGLIYVATRKQCEEVAALAQSALEPLGFSAASYHAGMDAGLRNETQNGWLDGSIQVLVATNAFGMGIDKPDVRFVVHYVYPDSLESYYQEAGRAGRDGRKSRCVILHHFADRRTREWFIEVDALSSDDVRRAHSQIAARATQEAEGLVARIPRSWWKMALDWNEVKARLATGELVRAGLVARVAETSDETILRVLNRDFPPLALRRIQMDLQKQQQERLRRLDEMIAYCKTSTCRRRTVLNYFGDDEEFVQAEFCCDNCDNPPQAKAALTTDNTHAHDAAPMPQTLNGADIHSLLQGLDALRPRLGKAKLNKLLRASTAKDVERFKTSPLFGALKGSSETQADAFLSALIAQGLLHQGEEEDYFVCTVTRQGREVWQQKAPLELEVSGLTRRSSRPANGAPSTRSVTLSDDEEEEDEELFEDLRSWRRRLANEENVPPYCVFSDRTLREMARAKPQNEAELRGVTGVGDAKLQKYGASVLKVLRQDAAVVSVTNNVTIAGAQAAIRPSNETSDKASQVRGQLAQAVADLPDEVVDTYVMLQEGQDVAQIHASSGANVEEHLRQIVAAGLLEQQDFDALMRKE